MCTIPQLSSPRFTTGVLIQQLCQGNERLRQKPPCGDPTVERIGCQDDSAENQAVRVYKRGMKWRRSRVGLAD
jgi:hypothetical protein